MLQFINLQYLERKPHQQKLVFMLALYPSRIAIEKFWFSEWRKTGGPEEKPSEPGENQQQTCAS